LRWLLFCLRAAKSPLAVCASAGLSEILLGVLDLLRHTGHNRQPALRMVVEMAVMVLTNAHCLNGKRSPRQCQSGSL
jgi:hypothetical protein